MAQVGAVDSCRDTFMSDGSVVQVVRSAVKRMHVAAVTDRRLVHFRPCLAQDPDSPHANDSVRARPMARVNAGSSAVPMSWQASACIQTLRANTCRPDVAPVPTAVAGVRSSNDVGFPGITK